MRRVGLMVKDWNRQYRVRGKAYLKTRKRTYSRYPGATKSAALSIAKEFIEAARFPDVTDKSGFKKQLLAIQGLLGRIDPNYAYDLQLISNFDFEAPMTIEARAGLVMTTIEGTKQGGAIRIDVFAKHSAATDLAPISGHLTLCAEYLEQREELQNFFDFGIPLKSFPATFSASGQRLLSDVDEAHEGTVTMLEHPSSTAFRASIRNRAGESVELVQNSFHRGRRGFVWGGIDLRRNAFCTV